MQISKEQILSEALKLPPKDRAQLIHDVMSSFELSDDDNILESWANEVEKRINAFNDGKLDSIPADKVFEKILK